MASLCRTEGQLTHCPDKTTIYDHEIEKLVQEGYVRHLTTQKESQPCESRYIPHHLVEHNGKHCLVFNGSFKYKGHSTFYQVQF